MRVEVKAPPGDDSISEVQLQPWKRQVGDLVKKDEVLVEIESAKSTAEIYAPTNGRLVEILKQDHEFAAPDEVIAYLDEVDASVVAASQSPSPPPQASQTQPVQSQPGQAQPGLTVPSHGNQPNLHPATAGREPFAMPSAERLLSQHGLTPEQVHPTGPGNRILKEDVQRTLSQPAAQVGTPVAPGTQLAPKGGNLKAGPAVGPGVGSLTPGREEEVKQLSPLRRTIAKHLVDAQQNMALLTTFNEVDMSEVMAVRKQYKEPFQEKFGVKLGFMSFFVKAAVEALKQFPAVNAEIRDDHIVYRNYYDIGIAIGGGKGLVVPILRDVQRMGFAEIEGAITTFAKRAADNKLTREELSGGTFTISNGGVYGSLLSTPIVNAPQSGILGMHTIQDRPVARDGQVVIRPMMYLALTYDHRIIDGREAVSFLRHIKDIIENPSRMLLEI